jgi:hypothetical protein
VAAPARGLATAVFRSYSGQVDSHTVKKFLRATAVKLYLVLAKPSVASHDSGTDW